MNTFLVTVGEFSSRTFNKMLVICFFITESSIKSSGGKNLPFNIRLLLFCIYLLNCVTFHENSGMGLFSYEDIGGGGMWYGGWQLHPF